MKTASELLKISNLKSEEKINEVLKGVEEHIIKRCEEEALEGSKSYSIYLKKINSELENNLLKECIEIAYKFEKNGYYVSITKNNRDSYYVTLEINIYWDKEFFKFMLNLIGYHNSSITLYATNIEENNKCPKCNEENGITIIPRCMHLAKDHTCNNINGCCFK